MIRLIAIENFVPTSFFSKISELIFKITYFSCTKYNRNDLAKTYGVSYDDIIIILTPGSRESEVERIYPIMIKSINIKIVYFLKNVGLMKMV